MKNLKTIITAILFTLSIMSVNAQINKNTTIKDIRLTNKPSMVIPIYPKADPIVNDILSGSSEGVYYLTMASLRIGKDKSSNSSFVGSKSTPSSTTKPSSLSTINELTAYTIFDEDNVNYATSIKIYTTKLGGQSVRVKHSNTSGHMQLKNVKINKRGVHRFIITGDYEKDGIITNYILNIFRYIIQ